jgi:hypothetical protein
VGKGVDWWGKRKWGLLGFVALVFGGIYVVIMEGDSLVLTN